MNRGKQVAYIAKERWKTTEYRKKVVKTVAEELIKHGTPLKNFSLPELVASVERFEEKVNTSAKTEDEYLNLVTAKVKSIQVLSRKAAEATNQLTNASYSAGTDADFDWPQHIYQEIQILKRKYNAVVRRFYEKICSKLQVQPSAKDVNSRELDRFRRHKNSMESLFSLFELSKSQITPDMKYRPIEADRYIQGLLMVNGYTVQQSSDLQSKQQLWTSISPEVLSEAAGELKKAIHFNDKIPDAKSLNEPPEMFDELQQPTILIPQERKRPRDIVAKTVYTPSNFANMHMRKGFNLVTAAAESDSNSFKVNAKRLKTMENEKLIEEIKYINNQLFDCEVVIDEKENAERGTQEIEGLAVKILFNAVTINQNLVYHFTSDKKSLMKPLRLVIPPSYPSSSLVILDELPCQAGDDLRALFERAKAKLRFHLQSMNEPFLIKDIARAWERCSREAILDYAHANGGGTFTSMHGVWGACD
ncbi:hypothetical protein KIW84_044760 [Lathyrus oleraceus]|uniref:Mediator complex subunit 15 KIX domain-containing protein n=1 Tax=Pisum sativum TaxID=3888 RepID=A0A9D5AWA2_PEA|nr:hypothetical protein KIW84_044760 [Pisum sativum]